MDGLPDVLDLGCGLAKHPGAFGVDHDPDVRPDLVHDLDRPPLPLPSDHFQTVYCQDVLEHIQDIEAFLGEIHRICKKGARVHIRTPHYSSWYAYNDPTHRHTLGVFALDRFTDTPGWNTRSSPLFRYVSRRILFARPQRLLGVASLANAFPSRWEQMFAWCFPAENLQLELEVLKEA
ncbi:MAG TPA: class I SAM-dependent methyltransferase [Candidatus Eisenbacteria bacterium]|nr:class I SAM-dependent methyltransferase [Candidatus Eisenbacteria bacterium]